jgi:predicted ATPase
LIPHGHPLRFHDESGAGLPAIIDALLTRDLPSYLQINTRFAELFPTVKSLSLRNMSNTQKALGVQLTDGKFIGAEFMSEGMLYYLAYAALPYLEPTAVILVEEPENGLHPARIRDVVKALREVSKTTQVLMATHSPLVINELEPEEVTVLTRHAERGTQAHRMIDTPNFEQRSKVYALGELWVSYADGKFEEPLFTEPEPTPDPGAPVEWSETNQR